MYRVVNNIILFMSSVPEVTGSVALQFVNKTFNGPSKSHCAPPKRISGGCNGYQVIGTVIRHPKNVFELSRAAQKGNIEEFR